MTGLRFSALLALAVAAAAAAATAVPPLKARVTDQSGTLSAAEIAGIEQRLAAFEQEKGSQIAVLMVPTTQPEAIEPYSLRVAEQWQLGRKGVDDGILLLIAKDDRKMRLEVGYGLEGAVPDAIARRIIEEAIKPHFRDGHFAGGIHAGLDRLIGVIHGEPLPAPQARERFAGRGLELLMMAGLAMLMFSAIVGVGVGEFPSAFGAGIGYGLLATWVLGTFVGGFVAGVALFLVSLAAQSARHGGGGGGWSSSGGWGGGFGGRGGFGGGGGFSGGGGGFGGGGASGGW